MDSTEKRIWSTAIKAILKGGKVLCTSAIAILGLIAKVTGKGGE